MTTAKRWWLLLLPVLLAGCLEVDQHPPWIKGKYAGKRDQQPYEQYFHHDRLSWWATLSNRTLRQNEYNRAKPPPQPPAMAPGLPVLADGAQPGVPAQAPALQRAQAQREQVRQTYSQQVQANQGQAQQAPAGQQQPAPAGQQQPARRQPRERQPGRGG